MEKYQKMLVSRFETTLAKWTEQPTVANRDVYRLLHSLKGTASSIGLPIVTELAEEKLAILSEHSERTWTSGEWRPYLADITNYITGLFQEDYLKLPKLSVAEQKWCKHDLILLVEDDIEMLTCMKERLEIEEFTVLAAMNAEKALAIFYNQKPDCVVLDIMLPDKSGLDVMRTIIDKAQKHLVPILLVSADNRKETMIKALEMGALDYIVKPFDLDVFAAKVKNKLSYSRLMQSAILLDELTGAFNRKFFALEFQRQLATFETHNVPFSLALIDIDHFKRVNDTYGHDVGDEVLRAFTAMIMEQKRNQDYFIRYGGEEFVMLMPGTVTMTAKAEIERLLDHFMSMCFTTKEATFSCTYSAGVVEVADADGHIEVYFKRADKALYEAKYRGRQCVVTYAATYEMKARQKMLRLTIVDDDPIVTRLLEDALRQFSAVDYHFELATFSSGKTFLQSEWLHTHDTFLVLLDGMMPDLDGLEVLRQLRTDHSEKNIVVIMLTGRKAENDIIQALSSGADDYMTKPFRIGELEARMRRIIERIFM